MLFFPPLKIIFFYLYFFPLFDPPLSIIFFSPNLNSFYLTLRGFKHSLIFPPVKNIFFKFFFLPLLSKNQIVQGFFGQGLPPILRIDSTCINSSFKIHFNLYHQFNELDSTRIFRARPTPHFKGRSLEPSLPVLRSIYIYITNSMNHFSI